MSDTYWIISAVIAVLFGISFALRVMERFLTQSNNVGDYVGKFSDFCRKFVVVGEVWHLPNRKKTMEIERIDNTLKQRREDAGKNKKVNGQIFH